MSNEEDYAGVTDVVPLNQQAQETHTSSNNSYESEGITMASEDESFLQEIDEAGDSKEIQRTSTPTKTCTGDQDEQNFVLSPVLNSTAENTVPADDQLSSSCDQSFLSPGEYSTQNNSGEESQSLYTSALSNINTIVVSDGYSAVKERPVESSPLDQVSVLHSTLRNESLGENSTQDSTWVTACGSLHEDSDLKDVTIRQEFSESDLSANVDDNSESTYEDMSSAVEHYQDSNQTGNSDSHGKSSERTASLEENSPDLDLLNEICEEATNMTIKEALICSLNPGVRAGLREGRLSLNESEILALEQYCEKFIDNLISQLLDGHWSERISDEPSKPQPLEDKAVMAQKLGSLGLETLKSNCDRFVHSIITESMHDSCFGFQNKDSKSLEGDGELSAKHKQNVALDQNSVEFLLPLFKESEAIQDYIGFLSADIIKSALANLSTSIVTKNGGKNDHMTVNKNSNSDDKANTQGNVCLSQHKERTQFCYTNSDMWESESGANPRGLENETNRHKTSMNGHDDFEGETEGLLDDERMFSSSLNGALETSLEFDVGDWEGGGFLEDFHALDTGKKQKIVLRELSFDEHADVAGTEVLAPVFLAIAEENNDDTEIQGMRKKAQSIENLCGVIDEPVDEKSRQRNYSAPKRTIPEHSESSFLPEEDNNEAQPSEDEYEGDEETEVTDEEERDDQKQQDKEEDQEGQIKRDKAIKDGLGESSGHGERFRWHTVSLNGREKVLDLKLLEPYMKVISHGGYFSDTKATIVVIAACYLPDRSLTNYDFLMEQLFFYVISTLELLATYEDYYLVYLNGGTRQQNIPSVAWMKRFYQYIEGGLKKRMKEMFIVHPSFRLKAVITLAKPFLNNTFWRRLSFVDSLSSLSSHIPVDYIYIPDEVVRVDPAYRQVHSQ